MILTLDVICSLCYDKKHAKKIFINFFGYSKRVHIPSFMIMSFYFMQKTLILLNFKLFLQRIIRLMIPYLGWPIIIFALNNLILAKIFKLNKKYSFKDLKMQLLWGNTYMIQYWFQEVLIFTTILFFILIFIFRKNHLFILQLLGIAAYVSQYSKYNLRLYNKFKRESIGRFSELLPFASTGFTLGTFKILDFLNKQRIKTIIFSLLIYNLVEIFDVFIRPSGVVYQGIKLNVRAISLIFLFSVFPSEYITNKIAIKILREITNYTAGIFYLHWTVFIYLEKFIKPIYKRTLLGCVYNYLICYLICFISMKLVGKTILRNLFS